MTCSILSGCLSGDRISMILVEPYSSTSSWRKALPFTCRTGHHSSPARMVVLLCQRPSNPWKARISLLALWCGCLLVNSSVPTFRDDINARDKLVWFWSRIHAICGGSLFFRTLTLRFFVLLSFSVSKCHCWLCHSMDNSKEHTFEYSWYLQ